MMPLLYLVLMSIITHGQLALGLLFVSLADFFALIVSFLLRYGYIAAFILLALEYASFPIPTEIVLPAVGYLIFLGAMNPILGFFVTLFGAAVGMTIDYYAARIFGEKAVYGEIHWLHIKRKELRLFNKWFSERGRFAVFVTRLLPIVRGPVSFLAGFAGMDLGHFYTYSLLGAAIWNGLLIIFGYYAFSLNQISELNLAVGLLGVAIVIGYEYVMRNIEKK